MKIDKIDTKKKTIIITPETKDDLWLLDSIIEKGDLISGTTTRKIKKGDSNEKQSVSKKKITLEIKAEEIKLSENSLRINGKTIIEKEDIPKDSYHTIDIQPNSKIKITKTEILNIQIKKLKESSKERPKILIAVMDREEASFALMMEYGFDYLGDIKGIVQKKNDYGKKQKTNDFYKEIANQIEEYAKRYKTNKIILASSSFWKDEVAKRTKLKLTLATCNTTGKEGINEVLKRPEIKKVIEEEASFKEADLVEKLLEKISKQEPNSYGLKEVEQAITNRAIKQLLILDNLIKKDGIKQLMKDTEKIKGEVHIISHKSDAGKKLKGLSGIASINRF